MNATENERCTPVGQRVFEQVIRDNLSPEGVATIIAFLQPATMYRAPTEEAQKGLRELEWFTEALINLLGVEQYNRLLDELGL